MTPRSDANTRARPPRSIIPGMSPERVFAAVVFAVCLALLLRLTLGARRRARLDAALRRAWQAVRRVGATGLVADHEVAEDLEVAFALRVGRDVELRDIAVARVGRPVFRCRSRVLQCILSRGGLRNDFGL